MLDQIEHHTLIRISAYLDGSDLAILIQTSKSMKTNILSNPTLERKILICRLNNAEFALETIFQSPEDLNITRRKVMGIEDLSDEYNVNIAAANPSSRWPKSKRLGWNPA